MQIDRRRRLVFEAERLLTARSGRPKIIEPHGRLEDLMHVSVHLQPTFRRAGCPRALRGDILHFDGIVNSRDAYLLLKPTLQDNLSFVLYESFSASIINNPESPNRCWTCDKSFCTEKRVSLDCRG